MVAYYILHLTLTIKALYFLKKNNKAPLVLDLFYILKYKM